MGSRLEKAIGATAVISKTSCRLTWDGCIGYGMCECLEGFRCCLKASDCAKGGLNTANLWVLGGRCTS